ncbi:GRASP55/65 PDZ-like domain family protein [Candida parapsilosis]|uniref:GRASP55_65 domain-containing protein n=2 Tax=Candida parapsilosis TaxID=5480 RepID=G8B5S2_CANPC|nr:uncharacterized protein CPAR2_108900 [Candida parapsilosis]KAF6043215.1 GRASP55/65 PDZ-like domain family protein [Candida parapsilosis]KAF6049207.1 GRASP55/65 PDZ-like domain family protein [Candida parapsilosis]KAF6057058.1 GRASP55/65 PDZ-like domain family protein [Candida parapsilosis]KAF6066223.1 GRASP55/65 PDZ-like domain family protein [Candida parapsilosis]KAI5905907.1 GRASP65 protein 1 [Candida parapsilosis]
MFSFAKKLVDRLEGHTTQESSRHDSYFKNATQINNKGFALRVLHVEPHSTAHSKGFESWFDYIIRINSHELPMQYPMANFPYSVNEDGSINYGSNTSSEQAAAVNFNLLAQELSTIAKTKQELTLDVWNAKGGVVRQINVPLEEFSQVEKSAQDDGDDDASTINLFVEKFKKIGLTVESQHLNTATYVWRILTTHQGSPAFRSQLVPQSDFIIGCDSAYSTDGSGKGLLAKGGESLLSNTVLNYYNYYHNQTHEEYIPITLYVYNHDYDILRPVTVNLSRNWGTGQSQGILGCDVGYGLLHRIPEVIGKFENNSVIDDVLFESNQDTEYQGDAGASAVTPQPFDSNANIINTAPPPMGSVMSSSHPPKSSGRKKKHVSALNSGESLSDYMNEELEKSKKLDDSSKPKTSTDNVPPPPTSK